MLDFLLVPALLLGYVLIGYGLIRFIRIKTRLFMPIPRLLLISLLYALIFGVGILGSGGDPGFAFPFPLLLTGTLYILEWRETILFVNGFLIPLALWWSILFVLMLVNHFIRKKLEG